MREVNFKNDVLPLKDLLFRLALRITLNKEDAEDIVQETLIRIWNELKTSEIGNLKAFAMTICRNHALDLIDKKERRNITFDSESHDSADDNQSPDRLLERKEQMASINRFIDSLPEKQRTAIQLRDIEGRTYKEIAEVMGISESDVKVNIFRARQKIKESLTITR